MSFIVWWNIQGRQLSSQEELVIYQVGQLKTRRWFFFFTRYSCFQEKKMLFLTPLGSYEQEDLDNTTLKKKSVSCRSRVHSPLKKPFFWIILSSIFQPSYFREGWKLDENCWVCEWSVKKDSKGSGLFRFFPVNCIYSIITFLN